LRKGAVMGRLCRKVSGSDIPRGTDNARRAS
jgi:hypothetical protein